MQGNAVRLIKFDGMQKQVASSRSTRWAARYGSGVE